MPGAPQTYFVTGDMPFKFLKQNHGVGLVVTSETEGLYSHLIVGAQYAFKLKLWTGVLSLGVQLGMLDERFDGTQVSIPTSDYHQATDDGIPTTELQGMAFDMSFGVWYSHPWFYVPDSSASHLTEPTLTFEDKYETYIGRSYYFIAGSNIPIKNTLYEVQPSMMVKSNLNVTQYELSCRCEIQQVVLGRPLLPLERCLHIHDRRRI